MHSVLMIANGPEAARQTELILREENVLIARVTCAAAARTLFAEGPFDAIVCAVDELSEAALDCLEMTRDAEGTPSVVALRDWQIPFKSFSIDMRVVVVTDGADAVRKAVRQQLRRIPARSQSPGQSVPTCDFSFVFRAHPTRIPRARDAVAGFIERSMSIDHAEISRLEMVIEEALTNAVYHGALGISPRDSQPDDHRGSCAIPFPGEPEHYVSVSLRIDEDRLRLTIADDGPGFDVATTAGASGQASVYYPSGRGLMMMKAYADSVEFNEAGNEVTLIRKRSSIESNPAGSGAVSAHRFAREEEAGRP